MDIQKELLAYEQSLQDNGFFKVENIGMCTVFDPEQNKYHPSDLCDPKEYKFIDMLNVGWTAWQAAKAQAIPDGFVVVPKEPTQTMLDSARDWSAKKYGKAVGNDGASGCYKAMIEAQEPAND